MVWVYDRTGSLLVAMLMHASLIVSSISGFGVVPSSISGVPFLTVFFVFTALLWVVVAAIVLANGLQISRRWHGEVPSSPQPGPKLAA